MVGRLYDASHRREPRKALNAFQKAVHLDPEAVEIYRHLVPLELEFKHVESAMRHATKATQLDPDDVDILELLGSTGRRNAATAVGDQVFGAGAQVAPNG